MKSLRFITSTLFAGILSIVMFSCSKSDNIPQTNPDDLYKVRITSTQFDPASMTMLVGLKVTWTNTDADTHSIVSDDGISFNSGIIPAGGSFSFTPTVTGTFAYHCGVHPGVPGSIYVVNK